MFENGFIIPEYLYIIVASAAFIGLQIGSFCNVVVHRLPRDIPLSLPSSHCPHCEIDIAWFDNIPLFSWLSLSGKCRYCRGSISVRYPILELSMAVMWGAIVYLMRDAPVVFIIESIIFVSMLWVLSIIDIETMLLPNKITFPGIAIGLGFSYYLGNIESAIIGAFAGYWSFWLIAKVYFLIKGHEGMGQGDFKLLAMLGAFMGWQALPFIIFISSFVGAIIGSVMLILAKRGMGTEVPYGPYLALAGVIQFFFGTEIYRLFVTYILGV